MGGSLLVPILPFIVERYRSDALTVGLLGASFSLAQFIVAPALGSLSDRYGRRALLISCVIGTGLGYLIMGFAHTIELLFIGRIIGGATGGVAAVAQAYVVDISKPEDRTKNFGLIGAAFGLGFILGPTLSGLLVPFGLEVPIFAAAAFSFANAVLGYFTLTESLPPEKRQPVRVADLNPFTQLWNLIQNAQVRGLLIGFFLFNFAFAGFQNNFAVFTDRQFNWGPEQNAQIFAYVGIISSIVQGGLIRVLLPRFGEARLALTGLALIAISIGGVALVPSGGWLFLTQALTPLGVGLCLPTLRGLISKAVSDSEQGRVLGGSQSLASLAAVLGPLWAGAVFDHWGVTSPYWTAALWLGVAWVCTFWAVRKPTVAPS